MGSEFGDVYKACLHLFWSSWASAEAHACLAGMDPFPVPANTSKYALSVIWVEDGGGNCDVEVVWGNMGGLGPRGKWDLQCQQTRYLCTQHIIIPTLG